MNRNCAIILGGSGGIGQHICLQLATLNWQPIVLYRSNQKQADKIADRTEGVAIQFDPTVPETVDRTLDSISGVTTTIEGIILGASAPIELLPFAKHGNQDWHDHWYANVMAPQILLKNIVPKFMKKSRTGTVVAILSEAMNQKESSIVSGLAPYVVSKYGLKGLLAVIASEYPWLKQKSVYPAFTDTPLLNGLGERFVEILRKRGAITSPETVAKDIVAALVA